MSKLKRGSSRENPRAMGFKFKVTDLINPARALKRETGKAGARLRDSDEDNEDDARNGDNRNARNGVQVSRRVRQRFGHLPTDVLLKRLRPLMLNPVELTDRGSDKMSGAFDDVVEWLWDDVSPVDIPEAVRNFQKLAKGGRRAELNQIFEHTVRTMAASEEAIQREKRAPGRRLLTALRRLQRFAADTVVLQVQTGGEIIKILSERVGDAMTAVGQGAAGALHALMGGSPRELFADWSLLVVAISLLGVGALATGAFALSTPAGSALGGMAAGKAGKAARLLL